MAKINQNAFNLLIGKRIRVIREKNNLTISELALKCDVNEKYLGKIERGECSASAFIFKKIAEGLSINLSILFKVV